MRVRPRLHGTKLAFAASIRAIMVLAITGSRPLISPWYCGK